MSNKDKKNIEAVYPLSPMQQGMLFHSLYDPESGVYIVQFGCKLQGELNIEAFKKAWLEIVQRHSSLRTSFVWKKMNKMLQVVHKQVEPPLEQFDWRDIKETTHDRKLEEFLKEDRRRGFVLSKAPLMRLTLIQLNDNVHQFVLSNHHLLMDGWSLPLLFREIFTIYEAYRVGKALRLSVSRPYKDYIEWILKQDISKAETFWRTTLEGFGTPTPLVVDKLPFKAPLDSDQICREKIALSEDLTNSLQSLAQQNQFTLSTLIQVAWAILLHRYSGEEDILFGATVSGRPTDLAGVEDMVGLFINTLPVRIKFQSSESVISILKSQQKHLTNMREFEYSPLVQIQGWSDVPRGTSLFESIVVFENYPVDASLREQKTSVEIKDVRSFEKTNYPITLLAGPAKQLSLEISYDNRLFQAETITRMLGHLKTLLEGIGAKPDSKISDLPILTGKEQKEILNIWNDTRIDYKKDRFIHQYIEAQVEDTPDAIALVFEGHHLTYREMNRRANQLAYFLRKQSVKSESLVGIFIERSLEMIIGILGIWKAGAAYVPLDPVYPEERITYMIHDSKVRVILTLSHLLRHLPDKNLLIINLDTDWEILASENHENLDIELSDHNLAYMIYTSGSTGKPKGTGNAHLGIRNRLQWMLDTHKLDQSDKILQKTPFSFDVSIWEFLWPLMKGAMLIIAKPEGHKDSTYLVDTIINHNITIMHFVPSMLQVFIEETGVDNCISLSRVYCSGEALPYDLKKRFFMRLNAELHNLYGPTEAAIEVTYWACDANSEKRMVPIGKPIANTKIYILDSRLELVPIGVPGELHIGGGNLARGYLNRPSLTAEKFIPDPFNGEIGARLYKTGDLARFLPDGNVEYLGRFDHQVKIRGVRVELGEIETVLGDYPAIREVVVIARQDLPGDTRLVAYFVSREDIEPTAGELRNYLKGRLPEYMIPFAFVNLESIPLLPSGKVDRRALPKPDQTRDDLDVGYVAPRTPAEELMANIWSEILGLEKISVYDNFFDLGGHSLLATQLTSRIRDAFQVEIPLPQVFESRSLLELVDRIESAQEYETKTDLPPIQPIVRDEQLPLSFAQQRLWFLDQLDPGGFFYNIPVALKLKGTLNVPALNFCLKEIIKRHGVLRTTFKSTHGIPRQVIAPTMEAQLQIIDLENFPVEEQESEVSKITFEETRYRFNLTKGPLFRTTLIRISIEEHIALITMHHIISDGWSTAVLITEFAKLYEAKIKNEPSSLPDLPIQYVDYSAWQQQWLQGNVYEKQLTYWKNKLAASPPVIDLPTDRPRPAVQSFNGASQKFKISKELSNRLNNLSRQEGVTLFMTMLAAFQCLLHRYCRQDDISVGSPISGRIQSELENLIGFFVNTLVLRTNFGDEPNFKELLRQVREMTLEAYAHQYIPFEKLVEELQPERDLSHSPLFQVMFVFQNLPMETLSLSNLTIEPISPESSVAKFDLTLSLFETEEGITGNFEYNTDLFNTPTIVRMLNHYRTILEAVSDNSKQKISRIPLLSKEEEFQIMDQWNDTWTEYHREWCLHEMFERQVESHPDSIAVTFEGKQITYDELNSRANQLAHYLRKHGIGPEIMVGLCIDRSLEMVVGILGVLKAGGAFIPLDPYYPKERLVFMVEDSGVRILLTQQDLKDKVTSQASNVICLDKNWPSISSELRTNLPNLNTLNNLAYIIYTSGSTGKPKGTLLRHQGMCNLSAAEINAFNVGPGSRVLQFSSLSFDAAVWEIVMTLLSGATLCLASTETITAGQGLIEILRREAVNNVTLPPSVLANVPEQSLPNLDTIITAGEKCSWDLVNRWSNSRDFFNAYGPTESTVCASTYLCLEARTPSPPIGRPIPNFQLLILDSYLQPVPVGITGELHIGGEGLARGYLGRPELTAEKFIPDPFGHEPGERLYKTGDLARYLPDGNIEFLGRLDHQVKVRGFRIELGEIESALEAHPAIRDVVVLAREDTPGDQRLVAYLVEEDKGSLKVGDLRNYLRQHIPDYMVPSAFMKLDGFPLTPSGKVDRSALPVPDAGRPELEGEYIAPRNTIEEKVAVIGAELLNIRKVGIYDNFFDLGGHSLLATQFISRLQETFEIEIPLRNVFEKPNVADLAEYISQNLGQIQDEEIMKIKKLERGGEEFDKILEDIEQLSEDEVKKLLADESQDLLGSEDENE